MVSNKKKVIENFLEEVVDARRSIMYEERNPSRRHQIMKDKIAKALNVAFEEIHETN